MNEAAKIPRPGSVAQYWRSIDLLTGLGVADGKLAVLFQTTEANIRKIGSRVYQEHAPRSLPGKIEAVSAQFSDNEQWNDLDRGTAMGPKRAQRLLSLEQHIERTFSKYASTRDLLQGSKALKPLLAYVANAAHPEVLRLRAILHQRIGWIYSHTGRSDLSIGFVLEAMASALTAYESSLGDARYLKEYAESALIAANSLLLANQPLAAMRLLDEADYGDITRKQPIGSDHLRQRATALFQLGQDEQADELYQRAFRSGASESSQSELDVKLASDRYRFLFQPRKGIDSAGELVAAAAAHYGQGSLQHLIATNWATATALWQGSGTDTDEMLRALKQLNVSEANFGHQATVAFLLSITPELHLPTEARRRWIRFLLYENAFRLK